MARGHRWLFERREKDGTHRYYLRARVPLDLVEIVGRREIKKSLGTSDRREALDRIDLAAAEVVEQFAAARRRQEAQGPPIELDEHNARRMAFSFFRQHDDRLAGRAFSLTGDDRRAELEEALEEAAAFQSGEAVYDVEAEVRTVVERIMREAGFPQEEIPQHPSGVGPINPGTVAKVDRASEPYRVLCDLVRRALAEASRRQADRLRGQAASTTDPLFGSGGVGVGSRGPKLSEVLERWTAERKPSKRTAREWGIAERRFRELQGDLPVDAITKAHVREFKDALLKVPTVQSGKLRGLPLPKLVAAAEGDGGATLSPAAVAKQLGAIKSLLSWAETNGYVEHNVASGVGVAGVKAVAEKRVAYSPDDLRKIFEGTERFRESHPARFWLPRMAVYTGARLDELGQLTTDDVRHRDGIDYLSINAEGDGKSLKTASSVRDVPLHPGLVGLGFLDMVAERRAAGEGLLFPDLKSDNMGKMTGRFSKWFTRHRRSIGINDPRKPFHSFRHGFKQACRGKMPEEVHDSLTGHTRGGVGRTYGEVTLETKAKAIRRVKVGA